MLVYSVIHHICGINYLYFVYIHRVVGKLFINLNINVFINGICVQYLFIHFII